MEVNPVKKIKTPKYPLKTEILEDDLKKQIPKRWAQSPAAKVALGALAAMTLAGCVPDQRTAGVPEPPGGVTESGIVQTPDVSMFAGTPAPASLNVAPLFVHGEGRGSSGCMMVAPPVFLSEDEALVVINEVAKEYGLEFSSEGAPEFYNVLQPQTALYPFSDESPVSSKSPDKLITLKPDFVDSNNNIAIEFVSADDVISWGSPSNVSVEVYETKDVADQLSDSLEKAAGFGYTAGVMYDPCEISRPEDISGQKDWEGAEAKAREMSEQQLKAQAKDFFEWLKAQGVI